MADFGPTPSRPRSLLVPIAVLCWETGRGVEGLALPRRSTAYQFFDSLGLAPLQVLLDVLTVAVALAALGYLWRARAGWAKGVLVAFGYFAAQAIAVTVAMRVDVGRARNAFVASRAARGELADPARVQEIFAMGFLEWRLVMSLTFFALAAWFAWRQRSYAAPDQAGRGG